MSNNRLCRLLAVFLCIMLLPITGVMADNTDSVKISYIGNTTLVNEQFEEYPTLISAYMQERLNKSVETVCTDALDFDETNLNKVINEISGSDVLFIELNVSKKYKCSNNEIIRKLETLIHSCRNESLPAVYFMYIPEDNFWDYREVYNKVANYYGITVIDAYSIWKNKFQNNQMKTIDFLTAGIIPSEAAHGYLCDMVKDILKPVDDVAKPLEYKNPMQEPEISEEGYIDKTEENIKFDGTEIYVS